MPEHNYSECTLSFHTTDNVIGRTAAGAVLVCRCSCHGSLPPLADPDQGGAQDLHGLRSPVPGEVSAELIAWARKFDRPEGHIVLELADALERAGATLAAERLEARVRVAALEAAVLELLSAQERGAG